MTINHRFIGHFGAGMIRLLLVAALLITGQAVPAMACDNTAAASVQPFCAGSAAVAEDPCEQHLAAGAQPCNDCAMHACHAGGVMAFGTSPVPARAPAARCVPASAEAASSRAVIPPLRPPIG